LFIPGSFGDGSGLRGIIFLFSTIDPKRFPLFIQEFVECPVPLFAKIFDLLTSRFHPVLEALPVGKNRLDSEHTQQNPDSPTHLYLPISGQEPGIHEEERPPAG
jgi:hypothetical protein